MKRLLCVWILIFIAINLFSQDSLVRKNIIVFTPSSLLNRALSFSYNREIKQNLEVSIKTFYGITKKYDDPTNVFFEDGLDPWIFKNPSWYYNRLAIRAGILKHCNFPYLFYEITVLYEYGYFENQTLKMADHDTEDYDLFWNLDRKYNGIGIMYSTGLCIDTKRFRYRFFAGMSDSYRFYMENIHTKIEGLNPETGTLYVNVDNTITKYSKAHISCNVGFELGFKF
jgi:hypothetical protein